MASWSSVGLAQILLVRDRLQPLGAAARACGRVYGDVDHKVLRCCSVPVLLFGGEVDDVCGAYLDDRLPFSLRLPFPGDDVEDLAFRVRVLVCPRPWLEEHAEDPGARRRISGAASIQTAPVNHFSGPRRG